MAGFAKNAIQMDARGMELEATLFCGQSFSWRREDGWFYGVAGPHAARVAAQGGTLVLEKADGGAFSDAEAGFWRRYFALEDDYEEMLGRFAQNKALARCVACAPGIRVLNQPFFDTLLSFIISANNNIGRITGIVQRLRTLYGPRLAGGEYAFPAAAALAALQPEDLAPLRVGYRAKYLIDAACRVADGRVDETQLRGMDDAAARKKLMEIAGVGPKVADCVLLFGLGRHSAMPMDVWMKRAMAQLFPGGMPPCAKGCEGIAQQYIFHWARGHLKNESDK